MPHTLTVPDARPAITTQRIESFSVSQINDPNNGPVVTVELSRGVTVGGAYVPLEYAIIIKLDIAAVVARMAAAPAGATLYDAIKSALYDLLVAGGHIGAGTVT